MHGYIDMDEQVELWLQERCEVGASYFLSSVDAYKSYGEWAWQVPTFKHSIARLGRTLHKKGFPPARLQGVRGHIGLKLKE
jgi:hypothetical protein